MEVASSIRDLANTRVFVVPIGNVSKQVVEQCLEQLKNYSVVRLSCSHRWRSHSEALPPNTNTLQDPNNYRRGKSASGEEETGVYRIQFQLCTQDNNGTIQLPSSDWETFQLSRRGWGVVGIAQVSESTRDMHENGAKIQQELVEVCKQLRKQQPVIMRCLAIQDDKTTTQTAHDWKYSDKAWSQVEEAELTSLDIASVEAESVKDDVESSSWYSKQVLRNDMWTYSATGSSVGGGTGGDSSSEEDNYFVGKSETTPSASTVDDSTLKTLPVSNISGGGDSNSSSVPLKYLHRKDWIDCKNWLSSWLASFTADIHQAMDLWLRRMMSSADLIVSPMDADKAAEKFSKLVRRRASRLDKYYGDFYLMSGNYQKSFMKYSASAAAARANSDWLWLAGAIEGTCACAILLGRDFTTLSGIANVVEVQPENRDLILQVMQRYDEVCKLYRKKRAIFMEMFACLRMANFLSETGRHSEHLLWLQAASEVLEKMPNRYPNGVDEDKRIRLLGLIGYAYLQAGCWRKASFYFWREAVGLRRQGDSLGAITIIQQVIRLFGVKGFSMLENQKNYEWNNMSLETKETLQNDTNCKERLIWPCLRRLALLEMASSSRASGHSSVCLWSCLKALETSQHISPWDEMSQVVVEDAKIIAWMLRYPLSIRIKEPCGHFIHFLNMHMTCTEKESGVETNIQKYDSHALSPKLHMSPLQSPQKRKSPNPFIYSPFMNKPENNSSPETDASNASHTTCLEKGENYKFVIHLYNELKSTIPLEVLEIVTCSVQDNSPSLSEEKKLDTFSIHSLPVVLSQGEQAIPVTMKAEQTGHFCIIGFVARLWNKVCIDLMLEESCFVFLEIFSPIPTVDTNITLTSQYFQTNSYDILPSRNPLQNNHIFWDGERVTLHIGLQMNHCYPAPSVEYKLELVQHGADGFVEYEEEQMNQQLQEISLQLAEPGNESFQKTLCENGRCLLSSSTFISPQNFIEKRSFSCRLEFRYEAVYQKEASKMQSFRFSWMLKPWLVVSFIGLTKDVMEAEHTRYNLVLELDNWMEAPVELDIVTRTERCVSGLHLEPNECQRISFVPTHNLLSLLQQAAKDCDGSDSFDNKAIAIVTSQLECDWKCLPIQKFGRTPLRTSSRLSSCLDADLILPRANMEFCLKNEQKSSFFQVPCHVPLEVEVYITNCWWKSFPEDLCLSLKVEQATCGSWMNVMSQGVYGAGQWEDVPCGNISPGAQVIHSIQLEFISHGSYYLVAYLTSSTGPWKTVRTKALFRVQDNK